MMPATTVRIPPPLPTMAQQIGALAQAAAAHRRASYAMTQRTATSAERVRRAELDRLALSEIARRDTTTVSDLAQAYPVRSAKAWQWRVRCMLEAGWIALQTRRRVTSHQRNSYTITDAGRAMLVTLSPDGE